MSESNVTGNIPDLHIPDHCWSTCFLWDLAITCFQSKSYGTHHVTGVSTLVSLVMYQLPIDSEAIQDCIGYNLADVSHVSCFWELCIMRLIEEVHL